MKQFTFFAAITAALIFSNQAFTDNTSPEVSGSTPQFAANDAGVGEVKTSLLKPEDFARIYGPDWQLLAPRDVSALPIAQYLDPSLRDKHGKFLLPDSRGKFIRVPNNGAPNGGSFDVNNRAPGSYQGQAMPAVTHRHVTKFLSNGYPKEYHDRWTKDSTGYYIIDPARATVHVKDKDRLKDYSTNDVTVGIGAEIRVKNIALNLYVRVDCTTGGKCTNN